MRSALVKVYEPYCPRVFGRLCSCVLLLLQVPQWGQDHLSLCMARARQAQTRSAAASAQACLQRSGIRNEKSTCRVSVFTAFYVTKQRLCCVQALHSPVADTVGFC